MMNQDEQEMLSEHFSLWEMTRSGMAIRKGIENRPRPEHVMRMRALCRNVLEPLRRRFGMIRITSGYRCPALNIMVRGARNSQHQYGEAADIHIASPEEGSRLFGFIRDNLPYDQLLLERLRSDGTGWIHVSFKSDRGLNRYIANGRYIV
jgi:zinc D-Ala-D-Ala carboxypeptidase